MLEKGHSKMSDLSGAGLLGRISCHPPLFASSLVPQPLKGITQQPHPPGHHCARVTLVFSAGIVTENSLIVSEMLHMG